MKKNTKVSDLHIDNLVLLHLKACFWGGNCSFNSKNQGFILRICCHCSELPRSNPRSTLRMGGEWKMAQGKYTYTDQPGCLSLITTNLILVAWIFGPLFLIRFSKKLQQA